MFTAISAPTYRIPGNGHDGVFVSIKEGVVGNKEPQQYLDGVYSLLQPELSQRLVQDKGNL